MANDDGDVAYGHVVVHANDYDRDVDAKAVDAASNVVSDAVVAR